MDTTVQSYARRGVSGLGRLSVLFRVVIRKNYAGYRWVNGYVINAGNLANAHSVAVGLLGFERAITFDQVTFEQYRTSGYRTEDKDDFQTTAVDLPGLLNSGVQPLATPQTALFLRFNALSGRPGKRFYRYALTQEEVFGVGDESRLLLAGARETAINFAISEMFTMIGEELANFVIGEPTNVFTFREAVNGAIGGVGNLDLHHGWYNRSAGA